MRAEKPERRLSRALLILLDKAGPNGIALVAGIKGSLLPHCGIPTHEYYLWSCLTDAVRRHFLWSWLTDAVRRRVASLPGPIARFAASSRTVRGTVTSKTHFKA